MQMGVENEGRSPGGNEAAYVRCVQLTFDVLLQGKWRIQILCALRHGPVRIGQLGRLIPGASKKVLAQNLRKLEADEIVTRKDMSDVVLHIEYQLRSGVLEPVCALLDHLSAWGTDYLSLTVPQEKRPKQR
jgi:DNA-binding HxlR family transcriptional regulator